MRQHSHALALAGEVVERGARSMRLPPRGWAQVMWAVLRDLQV